jgi:hypothetical protein
VPLSTKVQRGKKVHSITGRAIKVGKGHIDPAFGIANPDTQRPRHQSGCGFLLVAV